ncbi:MAG: TraR/DksA family transcriptional regulator [Planctomycetota bacterium]
MSKSKSAPKLAKVPAKKATSKPAAKSVKASKPSPKSEAPKGKVKKYLKAELEEFKDLLLKRRSIIVKDVKSMENEFLSKSKESASTQDISDFADLGTENFEQEFTLGLIENEEKELEDIATALQKIDDGNYGQCEGEECKVGLIPKTRLRAIPYTNLCIECKKVEEENGF